MTPASVSLPRPFVMPEGASQGPLVSVIMSNYRGARYLSAAIESVLAQSHGNLELIVVDDASDDDSVEILNKAARADSRIVAICLRENRGPGGARNAALDLAQGDWIAPIDSDDLVHPCRLERLLGAAATTGADMVADNPVSFGAQETAGRPVIERAMDGSWQIGAVDLIRSDTASTGTSSLGYLKPLIRRTSLDDIRYDSRLRIGEDFDLYFRLLLAGVDFRAVPDPTYLYRRHAGSVSHRLSVGALSSLLEAQSRSEALCAARQGGEDKLAAALGQRRALLEKALLYEKLVAAIKGRRMGSAGLQVLRHPSLLVNLRESLSDRARRRRADGSAASGAAEADHTLVLAAPERIDAIKAPEGAERIAVQPMRHPAATRGADHLSLACRLARMDTKRLDVIADGEMGVFALGYLSGWRSAVILLPQNAAANVTVPAGATVSGDPEAAYSGL